MTELAALNVKITGDASDLRAEMNRASAEVQKVGAAAQTAQVRAGGFTGSLSRLSNVSGQTRARIQNTSFQLQDIAVQLQSGTRASTVFAQQLPQLAGGFGAVGAVIGVLAGIGIPALAFAFSSLGDNAKDAEERMKELKAISDGLKAAQDILSMSVSELYQKYGLYADQIRNAAAALAQLQSAEARLNLAKQVAEMDDIFRKFTATQNSVFRSGTMLATAINNVSRELGVAGPEARVFVGLLEDLENATGPDQMADALNEIQQYLNDNNIELSKISPELRAALIEANQMVITMTELAAEASNAAIQVSKIPQALGAGRGRGSVVPDAMDALMASMGGEYIENPAERKARGGGGKPKENPLIKELENVQQALMTQEELQLQSYQRQQETLQNALNQRLLTQEEYNALMQDAQAQHQDRMAQIDTYRYGSGVQQTAQFMGDMANALQNGNDKMQKIAQTFAAAETLINAWRAYSQTLADPTLPWFAKFAAAAGVLAAGMGAVSAIKGMSKSSGAASAGAAGGAATAAAAPSQQQQNVQTLNFSVTNDPFGISDRLVRQIVGSINEAQRNGSTLINARVT